MNPLTPLTIDANVWVARVLPNDVHHALCVALLDAAANDGAEIICPTLCPVEVVASIVRMTGDPIAVQYAHRLVRNFPRLTLVTLTDSRSLAAEQAADKFKLRGADAVYVAVAQEFGATLIPLDVEIRTRRAGAITAITPAEWLAQRATP